MASLLVGGNACIDETDGAGMDIDTDAAAVAGEDALQVLWLFASTTYNIYTNVHDSLH
jgi:hypothetical protein